MIYISRNFRIYWPGNSAYTYQFLINSLARMLARSLTHSLSSLKLCLSPFPPPRSMYKYSPGDFDVRDSRKMMNPHTDRLRVVLAE